jgi:drug/metabolite transporter (DMT)-like permease
MTKNRAWWSLHAIVFIWGFTGILGKEITLSPIPLVFWRTLIAISGVLLVVIITKKKMMLPWRRVLQLALVGLLIAGHWIAFFTSIKQSNISTALTVLSTNAIFTSLVAPLILGGRWKISEIILGSVGTLGLSLIFHFEGQYTMGILWSLLAAFLAAIFSSANARLVRNMEPITMTAYELIFANLWVLIYILLDPQVTVEWSMLSSRNIFLLGVLGWVATSLPFIISIEVMKKLSPFTCAIAINMEPVYSIILALLLYGADEYMSAGFYWGALLILSVVFFETIMSKKRA